MTDEERDRMIQETHEKVNTVTIVLLGVPGTEDTGLVGKVNNICESHFGLLENHNKLKTTVYWLIGILVGGGVLTGSAFGIADMIKSAAGGG